MLHQLIEAYREVCEICGFTYRYSDALAFAESEMARG